MVRIGSRHQEDEQTQQTRPFARSRSSGVRIGSRHGDDYVPLPANEATPPIDEPPSPTDEIGIDIVEENSKVDDILIQEYLESSDPFYDEEYLRSLDSQKLTDVLYEENPVMVEKHLPNLFGKIDEQEAQGEFAGQEVRPRENLTWREKSENVIVDSLIKTGVTKNRKTARAMAQDFVGNPNTDSIVESIGALDLSPVGAVFALNEAYDEIKRLSNADANMGEYAVPVIAGTLSALEGLVLTKPLAKIGKKALTGKSTIVKNTDEILEEYAKKEQQAKDKYLKRKFQIDTARVNTDAEIDAKQKLAAKKAEENKDIASEFIEEFEKKTGKEISDTTKDGLKVLNPTKAREAGLQTLEAIDEQTRDAFKTVLGKDVNTFTAEGLNIIDETVLLAGQGDSLTRPVLRQEKLDGLVAASADLKDKIGDAFDNNKTVIDNLLEYTLMGEKIAGDELIDTLNKYDVSFEDYILGVVGSGSEAGKTLAKLSHIKRKRPLNELRAIQEKKMADAQNGFRKGLMRFENIRRAGLVSQVATAARNLQSAGIRAPLEGLGNVIDTALYNYSQDGFRAGVTSLLPGSGVYKESFRHMKYMFSGDMLDVKEYVDFILKQPELSKQYDMMFNNINEIQKMTGRGSGTIPDKIASMAEDAVDLINFPNRWQEHLIRRGAFLGELERLVKREWNIDLIDSINKGKIRDMLNDAGTVRPEGGRAFNDMIADATTRALDITYAKAPDIGVFRSTSQFIVRNGLTAVLPFPRFMFNSMELMGQYMGGASIPLAKKMINVLSGGKAYPDGSLTAKDRQRISRNIIGSGTLPAIFLFKDDEKDKESNQALAYAGDFLMSMSIVGAALQYRSMDDAPSDYKMMRTISGNNIDTTPQFPMRQFLYLGEATRRMLNGTFYDFFNAREFSETFLGTNIRQGVGNSLIDEVVQLGGLALGKTGDLVKEERAGKALGRILGQYLATFLVPFGQIIEGQRALGMRGLEIKDTGYEPELDFGDTFMQELSRPFNRFGSAEYEAEKPDKQFLFAEKKERVAPILKVLGGINITTADDEYGEYIASFGYTDFELGSKSRVNSIRNAENKYVRDALPEIVEVAKGYEQQLREEYKDSDETFKAMQTEEAYVSTNMRMLLKTQINKARREITADGKSLLGDAPTKLEYMAKYRRLPSEARKVANIQFEREYGRAPDAVNSLNDLIDLAIRGQEYLNALRK